MTNRTNGSNRSWVGKVVFLVTLSTLASLGASTMATNIANYVSVNTIVSKKQWESNNERIASLENQVADLKAQSPSCCGESETTEDAPDALPLFDPPRVVNSGDSRDDVLRKCGVPATITTEKNEGGISYETWNYKYAGSPWDYQNVSFKDGVATNWVRFAISSQLPEPIERPYLGTLHGLR